MTIQKFLLAADHISTWAGKVAAWLILLLMIESVLRHDISMAVKERIYQAAFVVLVVFFAFVIFNDFSKLTMFSHLRQ